MEDYLEDMYQQYQQRKGKREEAARVKRARLGETGDLDSEEEGVAPDADADEALPAPEFEACPRVFNPNKSGIRL